jgi:shikimate 5-dehydrogenase
MGPREFHAEIPSTQDRALELARGGAAEGCQVVEGLEMLVQQGGLSFEAWTGVGAPLEVMREAADLAVGARS